MPQEPNEPQPLAYLIDDEPAVLRSITRVLQAAGIRTQTFESPTKFLNEHDGSIPGCAVVDLSMPELGGLDIQKRLSSNQDAFPPRPIIFLTGRAEVPQAVAAMKQGAVDFLTKPVDASVLVGAVTRAFDRDLETRRRVVGVSDLVQRLGTLTHREKEVFVEVVTGKINKQIAATLGAGEGTIKVHRSRVMRKMRTSSLADLVRIADRLREAGVNLSHDYTKVQ